MDGPSSSIRHCDYILEAAWVVTQNAERSVLENAALAVDKGRILAVGPIPEIHAAYAPVERIDLGDSLLMPGLINAHTHASMSILRGFADDLPLQDWLTKHIFPLEARLTPELVEWGALLGCAEMIRTGTTSFADMYLAENAVLAAADRSGLRCLAGEGIFSFPSIGYPDRESAFALVRGQAAARKDHPRLRVAVAPHAVYTTTPDLLARCAALARELDAPVMIHAAENNAETRQSLELFGKRPIALCAEAGLLTPRTTLAHCVDLDDAELTLLAQTGVCIAHNPRSNMKLASGVARLGDMRRHGVSVALGTDGAASNNQLNMFAELSACALLHKTHNLDPTAASAQAVLDAATLGGAHALGIVPGQAAWLTDYRAGCQPGCRTDCQAGCRTDSQPNCGADCGADPWAGLGSLTPGAPADCIALDLAAPNLQPMYSPVSHLVYAASGHETRFSMVGGTILYRDGKFLTIEYPELLREIQKIRAWVKP